MHELLATQWVVVHAVVVSPSCLSLLVGGERERERKEREEAYLNNCGIQDLPTFAEH